MIFVLAEHMGGNFRDVTFEMLAKGKTLAGKMGLDLVAVLLGKNTQKLADKLSYYAGKVLVVEDDGLENFNSDVYQKVLCRLIAEKKPFLTLMGHTSFGMELAPSLATELCFPLVTDCIDIEIADKDIIAIRQIYGGKINCRLSFKGNQRIVTIRQGVYKAEEKGISKGKVVEFPSPLQGKADGKRFIEYLEAQVGDVDIVQADVIVAVGRGVKNKEDIQTMENLAEAVGGVLACSRPIVDRGWLPRERQVGTSGKAVKPKLYIAVGISGAPQHIAGIKSSDTIIAINKDPDAPILSVAHYAIIDDLHKVVPLLKEKISELKG